MLYISGLLSVHPKLRPLAFVLFSCQAQTGDRSPMLLPLLSCLADFMDIDAIGNEAFMSELFINHI